MKSSNIQARSSREASSFNLQIVGVRRLVLGSWNFSGAWMLEFEASSSA
jgi:hypothetical protein